MYEIGVFPDWWKLEPSDSTAEFEEISGVIDANDPWCRGVVLLGLAAPSEKLLESFAAAARFPRIKGFAVGRTIWADAANAWFAGEMDDSQCREAIAAKFAELANGWFDALSAASH
jgi:5-dehydro-2-deoxygluconokinase